MVMHTVLNNCPKTSKRNILFVHLCVNIIIIFQEYGTLRSQYDRAKVERDKKHEVLKEEFKKLAPLETKNKILKAQRDELEQTTREMVSMFM